MFLKSVEETEIIRDVDGFVTIIQSGGRVMLSADQLDAFLEWLREGNGLSLQADWNKGVSVELGE